MSGRKTSRDADGRLGVLISQCEGSLTPAIDLRKLVSAVRKNPLVTVVELQPHPCTAGDIDRLAGAFTRKGVERVLVAGGSERLYGKLYRRHLGAAGIEPSLVAFADIYEHCALTYRGRPGAATESAVRLIEVSAARLAAAVPMKQLEAEIKPICLVIGGGVAGISATAALASRGVKVTIAEKEPALGGLLRRLNAVFPAYTPAEEFLRQQLDMIAGDAVEIVTGVEPVGLKGRVGDYLVELSDGRTVEAGVIVVAAGADLLEPEGLFGYGEIEGVVTQIQLEDMLKQGTDPGESIVMIQCAGSRNEDRPYCSRICCTASIKNTVLIKERHPSARITVLSRGFAEYAGDLDRAREMGVDIIRYSPERPPRVYEGAVEVYDQISEMETRIPCDWVVLAVPMVGSRSGARLAGALRLPRDEFGFLVEPTLKVRPEEHAPRGIFVAGCARWPATMTEAMLEGYRAASQALELISRQRITRTSHVVEIDDRLCRGCRRCEEACAHGAIRVETASDGLGRAEVIPVQCTGCGVCVSGCPSGALNLGEMSGEQIDLTLEAIDGA
jgi:heterodisulfide reductase subunit A